MYRYKMLCGKLYTCFIICVVTLDVVKSSTEQTTVATNAMEDTERRFQITLRSFTKEKDRWVTQVHMERRGFADEGEILPVRFSVEQNWTSSRHPPRLVARLEAASHFDNEIEEISRDGFYLVVHPRAIWFSANIFCRFDDYNLALPTSTALAWMQNTRRSASAAANITEVYVGISNITPNNAFETVLGQKITDDAQILKNTTEVKCGFLDISRLPYTLRFDGCFVSRPFMCGRQRGNASETFDLSSIPTVL